MMYERSVMQWKLLLKIIEFDKEAIDENKKDIVELKDDMERHTKISKR